MRIYPFFIPHAGCPHRCLFCRQHATTGAESPPSPGDVAAALERWLPEQGEGEAAFYGGSFTWLVPEQQIAYLQAVRPFVAAGRLSGVRISTRPDGLGPKQLELLSQNGVTTVEIGCQSLSPEVLRKSRRGHGAEAAAEAAARVREAGLRLGLQLMPGLPGAGPREGIESLARALDLGPDFLRIYPAVVLKGTDLEKLWRAGSFRPLELEEAVEICAEMLWRCQRAGVQVIRTGLQATAELDRGEAIAAGPYHPAFGQLVRSRLWRRALRRATLLGEGQLAVHPADFSDAIGHGRSNLLGLDSEFGSFIITRAEQVPRGTLRCGERCIAIFDLACYEE